MPCLNGYKNESSRGANPLLLSFLLLTFMGNPEIHIFDQSCVLRKVDHIAHGHDDHSHNGRKCNCLDSFFLTAPKSIQIFHHDSFLLF